MKLAFCLAAAVVVMPTMALDDAVFAVDKERLWLRLVLPDAAGAFPTNASPYWEKVSRVEFTNILERISKMTQLKSLSFGLSFIADKHDGTQSRRQFACWLFQQDRALAAGAAGQLRPFGSERLARRRGQSRLAEIAEIFHGVERLSGNRKTSVQSRFA